VSRTLPFIIECAAAGSPRGVSGLLQFWHSQRSEIEREMHRHGAVLFRDFDIGDLQSFQHLVAQLGEELTDYKDGNSPRTDKGSGVYTSTEYPAPYFISLHNELSYSANWPARLFFCCIQPAESGGETPLVDSRELLEALPAQIVDEFQTRQIRYLRNLPGGDGFGPSWQKTFATSDPAVAERYARDAGMDVEWLRNGWLRISSDQFHPSTHPESVYQSMMTLYKGREDMLPQNATYGDGSPIPVSHLRAIREITRSTLRAFPWERGDLLMVDNMLVAHGRMPFKGPRSVLVAMTRS
jgi:TfdA family taurine catabolism dioxygenase TauD